MDQTEIRRRLEEKVAEMIAPQVAGRATRMFYNKTYFLPSNVFRQYMADEEPDRKVGNVLHTQIH